MQERTKLFPFQEEDVARIEEYNGRVLLANEMGLGKSITTITYAFRNNTFPCVIICPASLKWVWAAEIAKHLGERSLILSTRTPHPIVTQERWIIVNYDVLDAWLHILKKLRPKLVVADECHFLKSGVSRRFRCTKDLTERTEKLILVSGSPMTNRPIELFPLLHLLHPKKKRFRSKQRFGFKFCAPKKAAFGRGWDFTGASNLPLLHRVLKKAGMIRRRKKDVLKDLPAKRHSVVPLDIKDRKTYEAAANDMRRWLDTAGSVDRWSSGRRVEAMVRAGELRRLAAVMKLPSVYEWIDNWLESTNEKLIVFGIHKKVMKPLRERYAGQCVTVTGATPDAKRKIAFETFNGNRKCRILFGNIQAAGTGWSARKCSNVAFVEVSYVPADHAQASDRVHGVGRGQEGVRSVAHWLIAKDTAEEKLCRIVQKKSRDIDMTIDGEKTGELDIFRQYMAVLRET